MYENTLLPSRTKAWSSIASSSFHQRLQHLGGLIKRQESLLASGLQICQLMTKIFNPYARIVGLAGILCLLSVQIPVMAASPSQDSQKARSGDAQQLVKAFEERVKEYVKLREQLE
ncbi:MAG TPA: hypothetical protein VNO70_21860, partial [Blastocatellia bacterium]|nr:hypothetical protein [Blastocatellia bacterium]